MKKEVAAHALAGAGLTVIYGVNTDAREHIELILKNPRTLADYGRDFFFSKTRPKWISTASLVVGGDEIGFQYFLRGLEAGLAAIFAYQPAPAQTCDHPGCRPN